MHLFKSIASISACTMGSRILGFIRTIIMASFLGTSIAADALSIAVKLPSMMRRLFAEGAFNAAFIPIYVGLLSNNDNKNAHKFANNTFNFLLIALTLITLIVEIFMPEILKLMVFGFSEKRLEITIELARITFPFIFFISVSAFYGGILNSMNQFLAFASSPVIGNLSLIIVTLIGMKYTKTEYAFAIAIFICGLIQLCWVYIPIKRQKIKFKIFLPKINSRIKQFSSRFIPAAAGSGVVQINIFIGTMIASLLPIGGVSILSYADRLIQLPLSVIGTAIGTALLPILSKQIKQGQIKKAQNNQNLAIKFALYLMIPATISLVTLAEPIISVLFERGSFKVEQTIETAQILKIFAIGLPAYILIKIFSSTLFAQEDTKTPLMAAIVGFAIDICISLTFLTILKGMAVALGTAIAAWVNVIILGFVLWKRKFLIFNKSIIFFYLYTIAIAIITFVISYNVKKVFNFLESTKLEKTIYIIAFIFGNFIIFFGMTKINRLTNITNFIKKIKENRER